MDIFGILDPDPYPHKNLCKSETLVFVGLFFLEAKLGTILATHHICYPLYRQETAAYQYLCHLEEVRRWISGNPTFLSVFVDV